MLYVVGICFIYVVIADIDGIKSWYVVGILGDDVGDNVYWWFWWVNIGVVVEVFFENIVLNGVG